MHTTSGDLKEFLTYEKTRYQIYYSSESKEGRGICRTCGKKKRYFTVESIIGIEEECGNGNEIKKDSDLGKKITEKLKRIVRRENFCDHCDI